MKAYLVSHNGLGDNIFMVGALNFLSNFYEQIYLVCKKSNERHIKLFFDKNIGTLAIGEPRETYVKNYKKELDDIKEVLNDKYNDVNNDIFVCGGHKLHIRSRITNKQFLDYKKKKTNLTISWDTINENNYSFINDFYNDIGLDVYYFFEYFSLPITAESKKMWDSIKEYNVIFTQIKSLLNGHMLNITNLKEKYLNDENSLLLCNDMNLYNKKDKKYELANQFVMNNIINYIYTIQNCNEIYIIDSCFTGILLAFLKTNKLKAKIVRIIRRQLVNSIIL